MKDASSTIEALNADWKKFFEEFHFQPHPRFLNTVENLSDPDSVAEYVKGYFLITGDSNADAVAAKCETTEARCLFGRTSSMHPSQRMNARLDIFYSRLMNGCDDLAMKALGMLPDAETVWCDYETGKDEAFAKYSVMTYHRRMESHDALFWKFGFDKGGKPAFFDTPLASAMKKGKEVIFQHVNLLPLACQEQLREVTDGKTFEAKSKKIAIKLGFRVVATMNLLTNDGRTLTLSPFLADRASSIREVKIDTDTCAVLAFGHDLK